MTESIGERPKQPSRASYLLDGRRVTVADLVTTELLKDGERLTFARPRLGDTHCATVTAKGWVRLENGEEFPSPSKAASIAVGSGSFDGWNAWQTGDGRFLAQLRQQLLDQAAEDVATSEPEERQRYATTAERHAWLKAAREQADAGHPQSLTVGRLLGWWGATGRGLVNDQIEAELANHSLVTVPGFTQVPLASTVQLAKAWEEPAAVGDVALSSSSPVPTSTVPDAEDSRETGLTVGTLPSALGGVISIKPTATFEEAITLMELHDFAQLPVFVSAHKLRGAVSWKSIARARHVNPDASFSQAMITDPPQVRYDQDLIEILPALEESDFVLVTDQHKAVAGIVTAADVAQAYGDLAGPFLLIGEMDRRLRQTISGAFTLPEVTELCDPATERIMSFSDMTIGDYHRVLENPDRWTQLGWRLDRKLFIKRLDEVRVIRNNVVHFNSNDPLPQADVSKIRNLNKLMRDYGS